MTKFSLPPETQFYKYYPLPGADFNVTIGLNGKLIINQDEDEISFSFNDIHELHALFQRLLQATDFFIQSSASTVRGKE